METKTVEFVPGNWIAERDPSTGQAVFTEEQVIEVAVGKLQKDIDVTLIWHDYESAIEYRGIREYIGLGSLQEHRKDAVLTAMREIANAINKQSGIECYVSMNNGKYFFTIRDKEEADEADTVEEEAEA